MGDIPDIPAGERGGSVPWRVGFGDGGLGRCNLVPWAQTRSAGARVSGRESLDLQWIGPRRHARSAGRIAGGQSQWLLPVVSLTQESKRHGPRRRDYRATFLRRATTVPG